MLSPSSQALSWIKQPCGSQIESLFKFKYQQMILWNQTRSSVCGEMCNGCDLSLKSSLYWSRFWQHSKWGFLCHGIRRRLMFSPNSIGWQQWKRNINMLLEWAISSVWVSLILMLGFHIFLPNAKKWRLYMGNPLCIIPLISTATQPGKTSALHHVIIFTFPFVSGIMKRKLSIRHIFLTQ